MTEKRFEYDKDTCCFLDNNEWGIKGKSIEEIEKLLNALHEENEELKSEINRLEELLKSYRKTIKHDAELLADASKKGYLPPLKHCEDFEFKE